MCQAKKKMFGPSRVLPLSSVMLLEGSNSISDQSSSSSSHNCSVCQGHICEYCGEGCLSLDPALITCQANGSTHLNRRPLTCNSKVRKGSLYYIDTTGDASFCQRCYLNLPSVICLDESSVTQKLQQDVEDGCRVLRKRDLLKRKCEEDHVEDWVGCRQCHKYVHKICAMTCEKDGQEYDLNLEEFVCGFCRRETAGEKDMSGIERASVVLKHKTLYAPPSYVQKDKIEGEFLYQSVSPLVSCTTPPLTSDTEEQQEQEWYTFQSGETHVFPSTVLRNTLSTASSLPSCSLSEFLQLKVRQVMKSSCKKLHLSAAAKTLTVRVLSSSRKSAEIHPVIQRHFDTSSSDVHVPYISKNIGLFQRIDDVDVCIFMMYVQQYNSNEDKRVYIAYLDSVDHFRPREARTPVYQEILCSYLAYAAKLGYRKAHIWACPPTRGNSFVFWSHPQLQKTPTRDRLIQWYHGALTRLIQLGLVVDVSSLYETFDKYRNMDIASIPPVLEGDFWMEECIRVHRASISRHCKSYEGVAMTHEVENLSKASLNTHFCNALSAILMSTHAAPFRSPVNPVQVPDYYTIIKNPIDLGMIHSKCALGEYDDIAQLMSDVMLMVENCAKYNGEEHPVVALSQKVFDDILKFCRDVCAQLGLYYGDNDIVDEIECADWRKVELYIGTPQIELKGIPQPIEVKKSCGGGKKKKKKVKIRKLSLDQVEPNALPSLDDGSEAITARMVGSDLHLLQHKQNQRKGESHDSDDRSIPSSNGHGGILAKPTTANWLALEVGRSIRRMRRDFFVCDLSNVGDKAQSYLQGLNLDMDGCDHEEFIEELNVCDSRTSLLEHCQYSNLQFDTLRRAKHSTSVILRYIHNPHLASQSKYNCSKCASAIQPKNVRWHRNKLPKVKGKSNKVCNEVNSNKSGRDVCSNCWNILIRKEQDEFVPIRVR